MVVLTELLEVGIKGCLERLYIFFQSYCLNIIQSVYYFDTIFKIEMTVLLDRF